MSDLTALVEDIEWMRETGETWEGACARLSVRPQTLERLLLRRGHAGLVRDLRNKERSA